MASVELRKLEKFYGAHPVVKGIDLSITDREFVVLVGPSGCGKSTTLRMIAGLESISGGQVLIGDTVVNDLAPRERDIAMVFQDYALYPHKSVYDNMAFSLKVRGIDREEAGRRIDEAAAMLGISELLERRPGQLSGGQRQRVAMGRAIVRRPQVFLFDEPLSNLDAKLRGQVRTEIKRLHQTLGTTIVYVTHDQVEAMTLADRIVILRGGIVEQIGTPEQIYNSPVSRFVAGFVGAPAMNFIAAERDGAELVFESGDRVPVAALARSHDKLGASRKIVVGLRPEHFVTPPQQSSARLSGQVLVVEPLGSDTLVHMSVGNSLVTVRVDPAVRPKVGETMPAGFDPARLHLFDPESERSIG